MTKKNFLSRIRETIARVSPRLSTMEACAVTETNSACIVTVTSVASGDLETLATVLCTEDFIVQYVEGSNFVVVSENPAPTQGKKDIQRFPISFEEGLQLAKTPDTEVILVTDTHAVIICKKSPARKPMSDLAFLLSHYGLLVTYGDGNNFLELHLVQESSTGTGSITPVATATN